MYCKSVQYQSSASNLMKIVMAIMSHEPEGNQTDVLRSSSIQKGCSWKGILVEIPDPDLRAQQYVPLLLQWEMMSCNLMAEHLIKWKPPSSPYRVSQKYGPHFPAKVWLHWSKSQWFSQHFRLKKSWNHGWWICLFQGHPGPISKSLEVFVDTE